MKRRQRADLPRQEHLPGRTQRGAMAQHIPAQHRRARAVAGRSTAHAPSRVSARGSRPTQVSPVPAGDRLGGVGGVGVATTTACTRAPSKASNVSTNAGRAVRSASSASAGGTGSNTTTDQPSAAATRAWRRPIDPNPLIPRVKPRPVIAHQPARLRSATRAALPGRTRQQLSRRGARRRAAPARSARAAGCPVNMRQPRACWMRAGAGRCREWRARPSVPGEDQVPGEDRHGAAARQPEAQVAGATGRGQDVDLAVADLDGAASRIPSIGVGEKRTCSG